MENELPALPEPDRAAFEAWIKSPPYERDATRLGNYSAWPGNYREIDVDLAWQAWQAGRAGRDTEVAELTHAVKSWRKEAKINEREADRLRAEVEALRALCKKALDAWTGDGPPIVLDELRAEAKEGGQS